MKTRNIYLTCLMLFAFACSADPKKTHVVSIDLNNKNLSVIPDSVLNNSNLTHLAIGSRAALLTPFAGFEEPEDRIHLTSLPDKLCNLQRLTVLSVSDNDLEQLPACLGNLQQLEKLDLSGNSKLDIRSAMPVLQELKKLKELNLYGIVSVLKDTAWVRQQLSATVEKLSITRADLVKNYSTDSASRKQEN